VDCDGTWCRHHHNPAEAKWRWRGKEQLSEESGLAEMVDIAGIKSALTSWMIVFKRDFFTA